MSKYLIFLLFLLPNILFAEECKGGINAQGLLAIGKYEEYPLYIGGGASFNYMVTDHFGFHYQFHGGYKYGEFSPVVGIPAAIAIMFLAGPDSSDSSDSEISGAQILAAAYVIASLFENPYWYMPVTDRVSILPSVSLFRLKLLNNDIYGEGFIGENIYTSTNLGLALNYYRESGQAITYWGEISFLHTSKTYIGVAAGIRASFWWGNIAE